MRKNMKTICLFASLLAVWLAFHTQARADNLVIIAASGAGDKFTPGYVLQSGQKLEIPAGGKITLISESGDVINLGGPYSGPAKSKASSGVNTGAGNIKGTLSKIAELVTRTKKQSTVLGASRKVDPLQATEQPDSWLISVDSSGHRCVRMQDVDMWRKRADIKSSVSLRSRTAKTTGLIWAAGKNRIRLPQQFVRDGTLIVMKIGQEPRRINLHLMPGDLDINRPGTILNWMIDNDCTRQADVLIRQLHSGTFFE